MISRSFLLTILLYFEVFLVNQAMGKNQKVSWTIRVGARSRDCFFVPDIIEGHNFSLNYKVIDSSGATGNLDVSVEILDSQNKSLFAEERKGEGSIAFFAETPGDYQLCLDNSYSTFSSKDVGLDMYITDPRHDYYGDYMEELYGGRGEAADEPVGDGDDDPDAAAIKEHVKLIRRNMRFVSHIQDQLVFTQLQDEKMSEKNSQKVTMWSLVHLFSLLAIGAIQVCMIKCLFNDRSFVYSLTKAY